MTPDRHEFEIRTSVLRLFSLNTLGGLAILLVGAVLPSVFPEIANVSYLVLMGLAILIGARATNWTNIMRRPVVWMPLLGGILLLISCGVNAKSIDGPLAVFIFAPLFLIAPAIALLNLAPKITTPTNVGLAAIIGVLAATALAATQVWLFDVERAGSGVNNPIHFAAVVATLGMIGLLGSFSTNYLIKFGSALGVIGSVLVVLLSGSRGPQIGMLTMLGAATIYMFASMTDWRVQIWSRIAVLEAGILGLLAAWNLGLLNRLSGISTFVNKVNEVADATDSLNAAITASRSIDGSLGLRLEMLRVAYHAWRASPVFGHGIVDYVAIAGSYAGLGITLPASGHLHNDLADFTVVGGLLGIAAYFLFLLAPLVEICRPGIARRSGALFLAATIPAGYFVMGLTNAMFGILTQTILFAFAAALISYLNQNRPIT